MSAQIFPLEILDLFIDELGSATEDPQSRAALLACTLVNRQFYHQASSHIFSSLLIPMRRPQRLNALLDIMNSNPDIAQHIRSLILEIRVLHMDMDAKDICALLRQLCRLRKFKWVAHGFLHFTWVNDNLALSIANLCTALTEHRFEENLIDFALFLPACHLESLTLIDKWCENIRSKRLSDSLLPLKRLKFPCSMWFDEELEMATTIMTRAAPTLTTLILSTGLEGDAQYGFPSLNSIVFPVLQSIQISCISTLPVCVNMFSPFVSQFLDYSAPMVNRIQIEFIGFRGIFQVDQPFVFHPAEGWSSIDEILSSPKYPALKTLDLTFEERNGTARHVQSVTSELNVKSSTRTFVNENLPALSSRSQIEWKIGPDDLEPLEIYVGIRFNL
ncbi:hypothetical protein BYT27DRAFT_7237615 [Phlegmacium glaucopus]|nr:hypothetical protein BYT27DRAFT_7237615 [Phlegmacium glaucopus]